MPSLVLNSCALVQQNFDQHIAQFYNSSPFFAEAAIARPFLEQLQPFLDNRSIDFTNMVCPHPIEYSLLIPELPSRIVQRTSSAEPSLSLLPTDIEGHQIFDFVNVQDIHNASFHTSLPDTFVAQAYGFANFHENGVFTDLSSDGIGNSACPPRLRLLSDRIVYSPLSLLVIVAIRTILPSIFTSLKRIANASDPLKLALNEISYKPFISLFNVTQATAANPEIAGIGEHMTSAPTHLSSLY